MTADELHRIEILKRNVADLQSQLSQSHKRIKELLNQVDELQKKVNRLNNNLKNTIIEKIDESI
jgi:peptidoglycan hydrolase CwlO-like protein